MQGTKDDSKKRLSSATSATDPSLERGLKTWDGNQHRCDKSKEERRNELCKREERPNCMAWCIHLIGTSSQPSPPSSHTCLDLPRSDTKHPSLATSQSTMPSWIRDTLPVNTRSLRMKIDSDRPDIPFVSQVQIADE